jgi:Mg-chelatase subunit ChlD
MFSRPRINVFGASNSPRFIKLDLSLQGAQHVPPEQNQLLKSFMLQSVHLDVSLNEFASHGALTFVFKNPVASPVEMKFAFPLMDGGAVITGITTEWDGQRISGRVRDSEEGKKEYRDAIAKGHTVSLVEHAENDLFMWRVGGIPGGSTVTVVSHFVGPVTMAKKFGKKPQTEITLTLPAVVPPWYGREASGDAALAFNTAVQVPASLGGLALAVPPFTATVRSRFVTKGLQGVTVTSPTHGPPDASSLRTSNHGTEVCFRDLFKPPAGTRAATNLQMRWVADGIVPNMACMGRLLAGAGQLATAAAGADTAVSQDAAATIAMEVAAQALAAGPHAKDAHTLLDKIKTQRRQVEQVCGVLYSEHDGRQPEGVHVTVLVDCSGSMYPSRIVKARKAVRALLTSLDPSSTFSVYLFGSTCRAVVLAAPLESGPVFKASPDNINAVAALVDVAHNMSGTELYAGVQEVIRTPVPADRRHNIMILTDGEVGHGESARVKLLLAQVCPANALVGIIGIGNEVTRTTLRTIVEGGLGPQAIMFDNESDESIASIVLGSVNALISSQLRQVNWPGGKMVGSQPHIQWNSSEVSVAWALCPEAPAAPAGLATEDEEWEVVPADAQAAGDSADADPAPQIRWLGGAPVTVAASQGSEITPTPLPTFLVTNEDAVRSMCVAAALARCRHSSCPRNEATKLALRYGFVCADADSVMVAISDHPTATDDAPSASFDIAIPSQPSVHSSQSSTFTFGSQSDCFVRYASTRHSLGPSYGPVPCHSLGPSYGPVPCHSLGPSYGPVPCHSLGPSYGPVVSSPKMYLPPPGYIPQALHFHHAQSAAGVLPLSRSSSAFDGAGASDVELGSYHPAKKFMAMPQFYSCSRASFIERSALATSPLSISATSPSLLDILGALQSALWSLQHPIVAAFLNKHLPTANAMLTSDAHATVAVIVVLRAKFKDSKAGWHAHVKRAAHSARCSLGDSAYASLKVSLVHAMGM